MGIERFTLPVFDSIEKELCIGGPQELCFDYDDVYHEEVRANVKAIVKTLNAHLDELESNIPRKYR